MSRDFTVFQFDVDEDALRRVLSFVPGLTPLPPDEEAASEEGNTSPGDETATFTEDVGAESPADAGPGTTAEPSADRAGVEAHLSGSVGPGADRAGARKWTGPSTPWPGAPTDEEGDGGLLDRLRDKRTLLIGGIVAVFGVLGATAVWFLKFRGDGNRAEADSGPDRSEREPHADDADSRSYPVDAAPVIGMAFLAVATVILRRVRGGGES